MAKSNVGPLPTSGPLKERWENVQRRCVPGAKDQKSAFQLNCEKRHKAVVKNALIKGYLKVLDEQLILKLQRDSEGDEAASELQDVRRIDMRYGGVQTLQQSSMLACQNLRVCNLRGCYVNEIGAFYGCCSLLKLDLADNQVGLLLSACSVWREGLTDRLVS